MAASLPVTLEDLMRELVAIRALLEERRRPMPLSRADRDRLARMLPAVGGAFGSEWFLVRELFVSDAPGLRLVLRGVNAKQVGRLLRRGQGQAIDGYLIEQGGCELNTNLWRVMQYGFPENQKPRGLPIDRARAAESC